MQPRTWALESLCGCWWHCRRQFCDSRIHSEFRGMDVNTVMASHYQEATEETRSSQVTIESREDCECMPRIQIVHASQGHALLVWTSTLLRTMYRCHASSTLPAVELPCSLYRFGAELFFLRQRQYLLVQPRRKFDTGPIDHGRRNLCH